MSLTLMAASAQLALATDCAIPPTDSASALSIDWSRDDDGTVLPELVVDAMRTEGLEYTIEFRLTFNGRAIEWTTEVVLGALTSEVVPFEPPSSAAWSDSQGTFASDLSVFVRATSTSSEAPVGSASAPPVRLFWETEGSRFRLYDEKQSAVVAPYGFVGEATGPLAAAVADAEREDDGIYEFGPGEE